MERIVTRDMALKNREAYRNKSSAEYQNRELVAGNLDRHQLRFLRHLRIDRAAELTPYGAIVGDGFTGFQVADLWGLLPGVDWSFLYGAYVGLVFVPIYNFLTRRWGVPAKR
jgi:hypothetical protein